MEKYFEKSDINSHPLLCSWVSLFLLKKILRAEVQLHFLGLSQCCFKYLSKMLKVNKKKKKVITLMHHLSSGFSSDWTHIICDLSE